MISFFAFIENEDERHFCERLYLDYGREMLGVAFAVLSDHGLAEDAVHNAFVYAAGRLDDLRRRSEPERKRFLMLAAKHRALNRLKKSRFEIPTDPSSAVLADKRETTDDALDLLIEKCGRTELENKLNELPAIYRDTLYLSFFLGLDGGEIAGLTETSPQAVWKRVQRGKKLLGELLEKGGESDE